MPDRYYKSGATVWNSPNSWSATSPTAPDNAGIPSANDDVFFTVNSNTICTVATTTGLCKNFNTSGWTGTITLNNIDLRVHGNIVTSSGTTVNGTGWFTIQGQTPAVAKTMTSNGASFVNFQLGGVSGPQAHTLTFNDILNVTNIRHGLSALVTTNGSSVNVSGSMTMENISLTWSGTTVYNLIGSGNGNFGMAGTSPAFGNTININKSGGTITFLGNVRLFGATFNYTSGTVDTTTNSNLFDLYGTNAVTTKNGGNEITLNNVRMGFGVGAATTTLNSNMKISGDLTVGSQPVKINTSNNSTVELDGNLFYNGGGNPLLSYFKGTSSITFKGTTDTVIQGINSVGTNALLVGINLIINKLAGRKVTLTPTTTSSKIYLVPGENSLNNPMSITVTSGSLDAASGSTVVVGFANSSYITTLTLNTGGNTVTFPNLNIEALNNQLNIT